MKISEYRVEFAAFNRALEETEYAPRTQEQTGEAQRRVYDRYGDLFSLPEIDELRAALKSASLESERSGLKVLLNVAQLDHLAIATQEIDRELVRCRDASA